MPCGTHGSCDAAPPSGEMLFCGAAEAAGAELRDEERSVVTRASLALCRGRGTASWELLLLFHRVWLHRDPEFSLLLPLIRHFQAAGHTSVSFRGTVYFVVLLLVTDFWGRMPLFFWSFSSVAVLLLVQDPWV